MIACAEVETTSATSAPPSVTTAASDSSAPAVSSDVVPAVTSATAPSSAQSIASSWSGPAPSDKSLLGPPIAVYKGKFNARLSVPEGWTHARLTDGMSGNLFGLIARPSGFDLEATTEVRAEDRERLENLCRYLLRPPLADRRLRLLPADQVALELKSPWKDGTRWISMSADTFLQRLCSLVPRPRSNQVLYRGVLAPRSARRERVVPERDDEPKHRPKNATFCELMKHGLGVDILACSCGHRMQYVATIFDRKGLARLLRAKGLPHHLEPIRPARGPPQGEFDFGP
jgi:hypothetical protein